MPLSRKSNRPRSLASAASVRCVRCVLFLCSLRSLRSLHNCLRTFLHVPRRLRQKVRQGLALHALCGVGWKSRLCSKSYGYTHSSMAIPWKFVLAAGPQRDGEKVSLNHAVTMRN